MLRKIYGVWVDPEKVVYLQANDKNSCNMILANNDKISINKPIDKVAEELNKKLLGHEEQNNTIKPISKSLSDGQQKKLEELRGKYNN